jgi:transcriptional regulator with XRE-family HTH domain
MPQHVSAAPWPLKLLLGSPTTLTVYPLPSSENALQVVRQLRHCTQEQVARMLGMERSVIAKIERRPNPRISTVQDVLHALGGRVRLVAEFPGWGCVELTFPEEQAEAPADGRKEPHEAPPVPCAARKPRVQRHRL